MYTHIQILNKHYHVRDKIEKESGTQEIFNGTIERIKLER